ncbi:MAG: helix-turn-helix domain-containing protein [Candidatus Peregrinibacteria bacterium]|nr:helix-turn-helix domain-containing protein [Candidatus Peregrinibacteria bacterium]
MTQATLQPPADTAKNQEDQETPVLPYNESLYEKLRSLRRSLAVRESVASYMIFKNRSLKEMATYFPQSPASFENMFGVSTRKLRKYGEQFLAAIREFTATHQLEEIPVQRTKKPRRERREKSSISTYEQTRVLLEQKLPLKTIARRRKLKEGTIIQHIEELLESGAVLDIEYLRPPSPHFEEIAAAFRIHGTETLHPLFREFHGKFSYDILRLVRVFTPKSTSKPFDYPERLEEELQLELAQREAEKRDSERRLWEELQNG